MVDSGKNVGQPQDAGNILSAGDQQGLVLPHDEQMDGFVQPGIPGNEFSTQIINRSE